VKLAAIASTLVVLAVAATPALATGGDRYTGETDDGHGVKLVTDRDGAVIRGAVTTGTECTEGYDDFRARFEVHRPLDRSSRDRFKDSGSALQHDERFSARYRYDLEGKRKGPNVLKGSVDLTVVFRKEGEEYTRCTADDVGFEVRKAGTD
jgi:hypothetical protein